MRIAFQCSTICTFKAAILPKVMTLQDPLPMVMIEGTFCVLELMVATPSGGESRSLSAPVLWKAIRWDMDYEFGLIAFHSFHESPL